MADYISKERFAREQIEAGLNRRKREEKLEELYDQYYRTGQPWLMDEIVYHAERLMAGSVCAKLRRSPWFHGDAEDALQVLSLTLSMILRQDREQGRRRVHVVYLIRSLYARRTMNYLDELRIANQNVLPASLEALMQDEDGRTWDRFADEEDITDEEAQLMEEKGLLSRKLLRIYLQVMLDYRYDPQKPLGLCFGRVLYQMERRLDPKEIGRAGDALAARDTRSRVPEFRKYMEAYQAVQQPATTSSMQWAVERMGKKKLLQLAFEAQDSIQSCFDETLRWSDSYIARMSQVSGLPGGIRWRDIIYTETYTTAQTSNWVESIHKSVFQGALEIVLGDPELMDEVLRLDLPFKQPAARTGKGKK